MDMLRNADIGLSFHFQGMEIIKEINSQLDQTLSKFSNISPILGESYINVGDTNRWNNNQRILHNF